MDFHYDPPPFLQEGDSGASEQRIAAYERTRGTPMLPRIMVPVPDLSQDTSAASTLLEQGMQGSRQRRSAEFLRTVTGGHYVPDTRMREWKYEDRRAAQQVLPFLYLGPSAAARNREFLTAQRITMVMAVRDMQSAVAKLMNPKVAVELGLAHKMVDVQGNRQLLRAFPQAIETINQHLIHQYNLHMSSSQNHPLPSHQPPGRILIFCETGNERSAMVAAAYIMAMYSLDHVQAIQVLQAQRFCLNIDDDLRVRLRSYHEILQANRDLSIDLTSLSLLDADPKPPSPEPMIDTTGLPPAVITLTHAKSALPKRQLHHVYAHDDHEVFAASGEADHARFEEREVFAPFTNDVADGWVEF